MPTADRLTHSRSLAESSSSQESQNNNYGGHRRSVPRGSSDTGVAVHTTAGTGVIHVNACETAEQRQQAAPESSNGCSRTYLPSSESSAQITADDAAEKILTAACKTWTGVTDDADDVVIRLECMEESELKKIVLIIKLGVCAGIVLLCTLFALKFQKGDVWFASNRNIPLLNVVVGSCCLPVLAVSIATSLQSLCRASRCKKRWSRRRKVPTITYFALLCVQFLNTAIFLVANSWIIAAKCSWNDGLVLWCGYVQWGVGWSLMFTLLAMHAHNAMLLPPRKDGTYIKTASGQEAMVVDMPILKYHWPKFLYFAAHFAIQTAVVVHLRKRDHRAPSSFTRSIECAQGGLRCRLDPVSLALGSVSILTLNGCLLWWLTYILISGRKLRQWGYHRQRNNNLNLRFQIKFLQYAVLFFAFSSILLFFVKIHSCSSFVESWLGFSPMFIVMTVTCVCLAYIYQPKQTAHNHAMYLALLQSFAWTESDKPQKLRSRNEIACGPELASAPMFCVETAVKLFYFSALCYSIQEPNRSDIQDIAVACKLYNLQQHEVVRNRQDDGKALLAWNDEVLVVAFRGTASWANVVADLQMWLRTHPKPHTPRSRCEHLFSWRNRAMVHAGFYHSWTVSNFSTEVMDRVRDIVASRPPGANFHVYVTGHSLGGALATLAAIDIAQQICAPQPQVSISVYTFGAPRTGNHSFAKLYDEFAPDTWSVINDQDLVARGGKFFRLYKRPAQRVLIDKAGTMLVRPAFVEYSLKRSGRAKAGDHHLRAYRVALQAILLAQFEEGMAFRDGLKGVAQLSNSIPVERIFASQLQDDDEHSRAPAIASTATSSETRSFGKTLASTFKKIRASESTHQHLLDNLLDKLDKLATPALYMGAPQTILSAGQESC